MGLLSASISLIMSRIGSFSWAGSQFGAVIGKLLLLSLLYFCPCKFYCLDTFWVKGFVFGLLSLSFCESPAWLKRVATSGPYHIVLGVLFRVNHGYPSISGLWHILEIAPPTYSHWPISVLLISDNPLSPLPSPFPPNFFPPCTSNTNFISLSEKIQLCSLGPLLLFGIFRSADNCITIMYFMANIH